MGYNEKALGTSEAELCLLQGYEALLALIFFSFYTSPFFLLSYHPSLA
jgi:hypothetical protein